MRGLNLVSYFKLLMAFNFQIKQNAEGISLAYYIYFNISQKKLLTAHKNNKTFQVNYIYTNSLSFLLGQATMLQDLQQILLGRAFLRHNISQLFLCLDPPEFHFISITHLP